MNFRKITLFALLAVIAALLITAFPAIPVWASPELTLEQNSGTVGSPIRLSGKGFSSNATSVSILFGAFEPFNTEVVTSANITRGNFSTVFAVPRFPKNTYTITAVSNVSGDTASTFFSITPGITINPSSGQIASKISVSGAGFSSNGGLSVIFDDTTIASTIAQANGTFSELAVTIPPSAQGGHLVKVTDNTGPLPDQTFMVNPKVNIRPSNVQVGEQIVVSGNGFSASSAITFALDNISLGAFVSTNSSGSFPETSMLIPPIASGNHILKASDSSFILESGAISVKSAVKIFPPTGTSGTPITVIGFGFGLGKPVTITFAGILTPTIPAQIVTDGNGNFAATINALTSPAGTFAVAASDGVNTGSADFLTVSTGNSFQYQGPVGSSIPISGSGFKSGSALFVTHDGVQLAAAVANNSGEFSVNITIPPSPPGAFKVIASDGVNSAIFNIIVTPSVVTSVNFGNVGTLVKVNGSAFAPTGNITIKYDSTPVAGTTSDSVGAFSAEYKAPASKAGNHIVEITDGTNSVVTSFTMDSTPPTAPALIFPLQDANADAAPNFQWSPVDDPSGVAFTLQIARDSGFTALLLEKTGLTSTSYQLSNKEKLLAGGKEKPYFWRVRAADQASNVSKWSAPQSFIVGFKIPAWAWYAGAAAAVALVFLSGFLVGRQTRNGTKGAQ